MRNHDDSMVGTEELEAGLRASRAPAFAVIAVTTVLLLLFLNSGGLVKWAQLLPSHPVSIWVADRAADWDRLVMRTPPAQWAEAIRRRLKIEER